MSNDWPPPGPLKFLQELDPQGAGNGMYRFFPKLAKDPDYFSGLC